LKFFKTEMIDESWIVYHLKRW